MTSVSRAIFCQVVIPRFCFRSSFLASSMAPTAPNPSSDRSATQIPMLLRSHQSTVDTRIDRRIRIPPMVGVPALAWWLFTPSSRMYWPILSRERVRITHGPRARESSMAVAAAMAARKVM